MITSILLKNCVYFTWGNQIFILGHPRINVGTPNFQHVFVIMMENTSYTSLIGNLNAPFINSAAATYGLATNYFGVTHPSQPNYIAATSGSTNGVVNDNDVTISVPTS